MPPPPPDSPLSPALLAALGLAMGACTDGTSKTCLLVVACLDYATTPTGDTEDTAAPTTTTTQSKADRFERLKADGILPADVADRLQDK